MFQWLADLLVKIVEWVLDLVLYIPRLVWSIAADIILFFWGKISSYMPDLSGLSNLNVLKSTGVGYYLCLMDFWIGLAIITSAYIVRFLIRRIPVVG